MLLIFWLLLHPHRRLPLTQLHFRLLLLLPLHHHSCPLSLPFLRLRLRRLLLLLILRRRLPYPQPQSRPLPDRLILYLPLLSRHLGERLDVQAVEVEVGADVMPAVGWLLQPAVVATPLRRGLISEEVEGRGIEE